MHLPSSAVILHPFRNSAGGELAPIHLINTRKATCREYKYTYVIRPRSFSVSSGPPVTLRAALPSPPAEYPLPQPRLPPHLMSRPSRRHRPPRLPHPTLGSITCINDHTIVHSLGSFIQLTHPHRWSSSRGSAACCSAPARPPPLSRFPAAHYTRNT